MRGGIDTTLQDFAAEVGVEDPIHLIGAGTGGDLGGKVDPDARDVRAPSGIVAFEPEEMTVRVRAGTALAELADALAAHQQTCALPVREGTVGGAVAVGDDRLDVMQRGRVRDAVLQVRYVSAEGRVITGGAPVVKNVSGFDLPRLLVGSLGTIGAMAEFVLRTNPVPNYAVTVRSDDVDPFAVLDVVRRPDYVVWNGASTWVRLAGHEPSVRADRDALSTIGTWYEAEAPELPPERWSLAPAEVRSLAADSTATGDFVASIGVGTVFATKPQPPRPVPGPLRALNERVKSEFDPTYRLNPGRSVLAAGGA